MLQPGSSLPCSLLLLLPIHSSCTCSNLGVLPCLQAFNLSRPLLTGWDAKGSLHLPSRGEQLQGEWEDIRTPRFPPQPCREEAQRTKFKTSYLATRQGWGKKERETLPGDKTETVTTMMAKQELVEEKSLQHAETLTGLWKFKARSVHRVVLALLHCSTFTILSNIQEREVSVYLLGFFLSE